MARACGSYPQCPRFKSRCRYHMPVRRRASHRYPMGSSGPLVKWLRHGPFTAVTWVRVPYWSPFVCKPARACRYGGLAQLVRAPASHAGGHWFESSSLHHPQSVVPQRIGAFSFTSFWKNILLNCAPILAIFGLFCATSVQKCATFFLYQLTAFAPLLPFRRRGVLMFFALRHVRVSDPDLPSPEERPPGPWYRYPLPC